MPKNLESHLSKNREKIFSSLTLVFPCISFMMDSKCILILLIALNLANSLPAVQNSADDCYNIYECCKKVKNEKSFDCIEYCAPIIVCAHNSSDRGLELSNEFEEETTTINTPEVIVINVGACRRGFR